MNGYGFAEENFHGFPCRVELNLYSNELININTGIGFLDHMLELFAKHGNFSLKVLCNGDLSVDDHHTIDEIAMNLGIAFKMALKNETNLIKRFGFYILPMDETLTTTAIDVLSGRYGFVFDVKFHSEFLGTLKTEMICEFWNMFAQKAECNLIIKSEYGSNDHHISEGIFKCVARSINDALKN